MPSEHGKDAFAPSVLPHVVGANRVEDSLVMDELPSSPLLLKNKKKLKPSPRAPPKGMKNRNRNGSFSGKGRRTSVKKRGVGKKGDVGQTKVEKKKVVEKKEVVETKAVVEKQKVVVEKQKVVEKKKKAVEKQGGTQAVVTGIHA